MSSNFHKFVRMAVLAASAWGGLALLLAVIGDPPLVAGSDSPGGWFTITWFEDWGWLYGLAAWATFLVQALTGGLVEHWRLRLDGRTIPARVESVSIVEYDERRHLETITARVRFTTRDGMVQHANVDCVRPLRVGQAISIRYLPGRPTVADRRGRSIFEVAGMVFVETMLMLMLAVSILLIGAVLIFQLV